MKTNSMKKIAAAIASLVLCTSAIAPLAASAASITISNDSTSSVSVANKKFSAYKVFNIDVQGSGDTASYVYTVEAAWRTDLITYFNLESTVADTDITAAIIAIKDDASKMQEFAQYLASKTTGKTAAATVPDAVEDDDITVTKGETSVKIDGLDTGYYLVTDTTGTVEGSAVSAVMLDNAAENASITLKADAPSVIKKIYDSEDATKDLANVNDNELFDANTASFGDDVYYYITSDVPDTQYYKEYYFTMIDKLPAGFTYNKDVAIEVGGEELATSAYNVVYDEATNTIKIYFLTIKDLEVGDTIEVLYSAEVTEAASLETTGNVNTVYLEYSNDPSNSGDGTLDTDGDKIPDEDDPDDDNNPDTPDEDDSSTSETPDDSVVTYITQFTIDKDDADGEALDGATFTITGPAFPDGKDVTTTNGIVTISGVEAGEYTIVEKIAPSGYNKIEETITLTIDCKVDNTELNDTDIVYADGKTCTWSYTMALSAANGDVKQGEDTDSNVITVINRGGSLLPGTGGIGTTIFVTLGATLMVGAAGAYVVKRRIASK